MDINNNIGASLETEHILDFSDRLYKVAMALVGVLALALASGVVWGFSALPQNTPHEISISGEGKAYLKPDVALVSFGVSTQELKSQDAVNKNNEKMNAVIAAIKATGVEEKDIQTTLYNLTPMYDYPQILVPSSTPSKAGSAVASPIYIQGGRTFSGYSLEQQISVKIRNFDSINTVLDKATAAGANTVGQLSFAVDNPEQARSMARQEAIKNAKEKLDAMVKESGISIGKLVNISEGYGGGYPMPYGLESANAKDATVAPQIQPGQQEISVSVNLTYQVK